MFACPATEDFFHARLDQMTDPRHPLAVLALRLPWQAIEASVSHLFVRKVRAAQVANAGRPCDATTLVKFRRLMGEQGVEELLGQTINAAVELGLIKPQESKRVVVDTTVQPQAIAHPTDSRLLQTAHTKRVEAVKAVGIAGTLKHSLIVGARAFHGNPHDGHTLQAQLEQATILMQDSGIKPSTAFVDLGYRRVEADIADVRLVHRGKIKRLTMQERRLLKRRQAIEPVIGHLKQDHRMERCHLKGEQGERLHAVLCAAGYNNACLLRMIAKKGVTFLKRVFSRLITVMRLQVA